VVQLTSTKCFPPMPKKIRELKQALRQAGFTELGGKGSHTNWVCLGYDGKLTISGSDGDDAKRYQEKDVLKAISEVQKSQNPEETNDDTHEV
jgi:predicted RNA binding protein YcfA (HicA-like mRNA interferase family)